MGLKKYRKYYILLTSLILLVVIGILIFFQVQSRRMSRLLLIVSPISAGENHSLAIMDDGRLFSWGSNQSGQLGTGTTIDKLIPIFVMDNIISVSTGGSGSFVGTGYSLAITMDNVLIGWGSAFLGQLGIGGRSGGHSGGGRALWPPFTPLNEPRINDISGRLGAWGTLDPVRIKNSVIHVSAGSSHSVSIRGDGRLFGWGSNRNLSHPSRGLPSSNTFRWRDIATPFRQRGSQIVRFPEPMMDNIIYVSAGTNHTLAITKDNDLLGWGSNELGQIGDFASTSNLREVKIMQNIISVSAGGNHTVAIKYDGSLWTWGANQYSQLGNGEELYGLNYFPTEGEDRIYWRTPVQGGSMPIQIMENIKRVSSGVNYIMAITNDGDIWAWGANQFGQLGDGTIENRISPIFIMNNVAYVSAGVNHTLAIRKDGSLWSWGNNNYGQL